MTNEIVIAKTVITNQLVEQYPKNTLSKMLLNQVKKKFIGGDILTALQLTDEITQKHTIYHVIKVGEYDNSLLHIKHIGDNLDIELTFKNNEHLGNLMVIAKEFYYDIYFNIPKKSTHDKGN